MASFVPETPTQGPPGVLSPRKRPLDVAVARPAQGQTQFPQIDLPSKLPRHELLRTPAERRAWYDQLVLLKVQLRSLGKARRHFKERSEARRAAEEGERARFELQAQTLADEHAAAVAVAKAPACSRGGAGAGWIKKIKARVYKPLW